MQCADRVKTVVVDKPVEECSLEPVKTCSQVHHYHLHCYHHHVHHQVTKLVPQLQPVQECLDVPKEVCSRSKTNPRRVKRPVIKKWCYVPSQESGLQ